VVGEFGGNDYNAALFAGRSMAEVRGYVPRVVSKLIRGLETIVRSGAVDVVVPGVLPIGCFPIYLTLYGTSNAADYDRVRLPPELQRPLLLPQRAAQAQPRQPAADISAFQDHVRRLLHPGHPHDPGTSQLR
jgi:hypothetical protein